MHSILVCGMAVGDLLLRLDNLPTEADKYIADNAEFVLGGGAANASIAIARLGQKPLLLARFGDDWVGDVIYEALAAEHVDCSALQRIPGAQSSISSVLVNAAGERQIVNYRGQGLPQHAPSLDEILPASAPPAAVLTDTRWPKAALAVLDYAAARGIPGILDAEPPLDQALLRAASHLAFSREGFSECAGAVDFSNQSMLTAALQKVQKEYGGWVAVTDGAKGVYFLPEQALETDNSNDPHLAATTAKHIEAFEVSVVDTLAAGDVWHGALAAQLAAGITEAEAIRFANAAAALKCTRPNGGAGAPELREVQQFLAVHALN